MLKPGFKSLVTRYSQWVLLNPGISSTFSQTDLLVFRAQNQTPGSGLGAGYTSVILSQLGSGIESVFSYGEVIGAALDLYPELALMGAFLRMEK